MPGKPVWILIPTGCEVIEVHSDEHKAYKRVNELDCSWCVKLVDKESEEIGQGQGDQTERVKQARQVGSVADMAVRDVLEAWDALGCQFRAMEPLKARQVKTFNKAMATLKRAAEAPLKPGERELVTSTGMKVKIRPMDAVTKDEGMFCGVCGMPMVESSFFGIETGHLNPFVKVSMDPDDPRIKALLEEQTRWNPELGKVTVLTAEPCPPGCPTCLSVDEMEQKFLTGPLTDGECHVWECPICGDRFEDEGNRPKGPETFGQGDWFYRSGTWWHNHGDKGGHCPGRVIDVKLKEPVDPFSSTDAFLEHFGEPKPGVVDLDGNTPKTPEQIRLEREALDNLLGGQTYPCEAFIPVHLGRCSTCEWFPGGLPDGKVHCVCGEFTEEQWKEKEGEAECVHDWTHDGDGALYCSKCKALDPYSNEGEKDPIQDLIDLKTRVDPDEVCPKCGGPLTVTDQEFLPEGHWSVICGPCELGVTGTGRSWTVDKFRKLFGEDVDPDEALTAWMEDRGDERRFNVEVTADHPNGERIYTFTVVPNQKYGDHSNEQEERCPGCDVDLDLHYLGSHWPPRTRWGARCPKCEGVANGSSPQGAIESFPVVCYGKGEREELIQRVVRAFLQLPLHRRHKVCVAVGLVDSEDDTIPPADHRSWVERLRPLKGDVKALHKFTDLVQVEHGEQFLKDEGEDNGE